MSQIKEDDLELKNIRVLFSDAVYYTESRISKLSILVEDIPGLMRQIKEVRRDYGREILAHVMRKGENADFARKVFGFIDELDKIIDYPEIILN